MYFGQNPTLDVLREAINNIDGAIPSWAHYRNNKTGDRVSQCTNCQKPHHGNRGCHLPPACRVCAKHQTAQCPLLIEKRAQNKARIDVELLKCINCGAYGCSFMRQQKPQIQRSRQWAQQNVPKSVPSVPIEPTPYDLRGEFPDLPRTRQPMFHQQLPTNPINVNNGSDSSNLLNIQQLQIIMSDIMSKLRDCKSKEDQFNVMFSLAAKYVYNP